LASPIEPEYTKQMESDNDKNINFTNYYPKRPYGFGMSDNEARPLLRGHRYGGLLECLGITIIIIIIIIITIITIITTIIITVTIIINTYATYFRESNRLR
jgi:hypothetical protein